MYRIAKRFTFDASHQLDWLPDGHKCRRLHGHTYTVEIQLSTDELDENGFVIDFGDLGDFKAIIGDRLDHRHLNFILPVNPTSENIARWLYEQAVALYPGFDIKIRVSETPKTWAEYSE